MPYTECTSLGSPTPVPTANPLRIYQELEAIDLVCRSGCPDKEAFRSRSPDTEASRSRFSDKEMQCDMTTKGLSPNPRRISACSSFYSTDDIPLAPVQSWIDLSDDEDEEEITYPSYKREDILPEKSPLRRPRTFSGFNKAPTSLKIERDIMEMLKINELEEDKEEEEEQYKPEDENFKEQELAQARKSLSIRSLRAKRQSLGHLMGKLKKSLSSNDPPEWKQQAMPHYFNYML